MESRKSNQQDIGGWAPNSSGVPYDGAPNEEYWGIVDIDRNKKETFEVIKEKFLNFSIDKTTKPIKLNDVQHNFIISYLDFNFFLYEFKKETITVFETSQSGNQLTEISNFDSGVTPSSIQLNFERKISNDFDGGAFTEASAHLLNQMSPDKRTEILDAYFSRNGANYSLTRTHMNSCDFSLSNYSYTPVEGDMVI